MSIWKKIGSAIFTIIILTVGLSTQDLATAKFSSRSVIPNLYSTEEMLPAIITQVEDSLGNINTNSWTKGTGGDWSCYPDCPDLEVEVGETIFFTVTASDPNDLPIEYMFYYMRNGNMTIAQDWSSDNTYEWFVSTEDAGPWSGISVHVRNNDGQEWQGEGLGDDYNYQTYLVTDPNKSPATIVQIEDSLGNINTNSWTKGTGGGWSCYPDCPDLEVEVGETITFTVTASDPQDLPLEYKFSVQPAGWSFNILQDWSEVNTFSWTITDEYIGPWIVVHLAVRNNDGSEWQGEGNGDDYTYAIYTVTDPSKTPATIVQVEDSLGNINTNSWTKGTGGDWSCYPDCPGLELRVDDIITYTVTASDPNDLPIEFKFGYMRNGGMSTAQDWSSNNTFEWHVGQEDVGPWSGISVHVRNNDGQEWQGEGLGDDYNYQTYTIYNLYIENLEPNSVPVGTTSQLLQVDGMNFEPGSLIQIGDIILETEFIDSNTLTTSLPESILQSIGRYPIKVINPENGEESNTENFSVETFIYLPQIRR